MLDVTSLIWLAFVYSFFLVGFLSVALYLILIFAQNFLFSEQNLAKKYNAEWALVTGTYCFERLISGGSSGIGLALVEKLATQGLNVVVAALDDRVLSEAMAYLEKTYLECKFRSTAVNLSATDAEIYMAPLRKATEDIRIGLVFNNAGTASSIYTNRKGYILVSLFAHTDLSRHIGNYNCNATASIHITHHFTQRMIKNNQRGLIAFTSSSGGFLPTPMTAMYSATKAFLTTFAASLAGELADDNIDVLVIHPSPIASNFYSNTSLLETVSAFQKHAVPPVVIANLICRNAGRIVVVDQGLISLCIRLLTKFMDWNVFAVIMTAASRHQADFKRVKASHSKKAT